MILIDINVFVIDRIYSRDAFYHPNRAFVGRLGEFNAAISVFTLLEICGIGSFNVSAAELEIWLHRFPSLYPVAILSPFGIENSTAEGWLQGFLRRVTANIGMRMSFGDAILLAEAESHDVEAIITWNTKDFARRARVPVFSPKTFLEQRSP